MLGIKSLTRVLARLGTPAGASVSVDIAALKTALDALGLQYVEGSVSDAGPAAADFDTDLAEATDNHYNGGLLMFTDGDCAGQAHVINDYDGAAKNVSFSAEDIWTEAPGNGDNFIILPSTGSMAKAIYTRLGAPAGASIAADLVTIAAYLDTEIATIDGIVDNILLDTQVRRIASGSKTLGTGVTKYLHIDSGTNGAEILAIIIKGVVGADWTLDVYVPAEDGAGATAAGDKRDSIPYVNTDTEGGLLSPFAIAYDCYLDFTNDSGGDDNIDEVIVMYRSRGTLTLTWET